jgi:hypothetical protein
MSDNLRRYRAIHRALIQDYPDAPQGHVMRHLTTLAALLRGMVGSHRTQFPNIATQVPNGTKPESRVTRFARWVDHATITEEVSFVPYAEILLRHLALQTLVVIIDGSVVGRGCVAFSTSSPIYSFPTLLCPCPGMAQSLHLKMSTYI